MSAVVGIFRFEGPALEPDILDSPLSILEHRGTDGEGVWSDKHVAFGHRMRWTTSESLSETLPYANSESGCVITCDARIDNREDLFRNLDLPFSSGPTVSDSQLILKAYEKWGESCPEKLVGDFVFLIWDPSLRRLFCARDPIGIKHFYYYFEPGRFFAFASEIKSLLLFDSVPKVVDKTNLGDLMILNYNDKENTPFEGIRRIPGNTAFSVTKGDLKRRMYWQPSDTSLNRPKSSRYYEEAFLDLFTQSVETRMRDHRTVGTLLSGGLDSSSISSVASRYLREKGEDSLKTFSAIFPSIANIDSRIDEREYIASVSDFIDDKPHPVEADTFSPLVDIEKLQWHADHPVCAPNVFMDWALLKAASRNDVNTLLSGFDGDSTVSYGYEAFEQLARSGRMFSLFWNARQLNKNFPKSRHSFKRLVWKIGIRPALPEIAIYSWRRLMGRPLNPVQTTNIPASAQFNLSILKPAFASEHNLKERYISVIQEHERGNKTPAEDHWNGLSGGLFAFALETFEKAGAALDVEMRFPFFDMRLIDFCINVPPRQKILDGWTRSLFRRSMRGVLPEKVRWRKSKANIGLSFKINLLKYSKDQINRELFLSESPMESFLDFDKLRGAFEKYCGSPLQCDKEAMLLMSCIYMSYWLRENAS